MLVILISKFVIFLFIFFYLLAKSLFTINEVLERRGENFVRQIEEKHESIEKAGPRTARKIFGKYQEALNNPPERKEVNIKGNVEKGKEIFQQIANAITLSDRQNFRFYP